MKFYDELFMSCFKDNDSSRDISNQLTFVKGEGNFQIAALKFKRF